MSNENIIKQNKESNDPFISRLYSDLETRIEEIQDTKAEKITMIDALIPIICSITICTSLVYVIMN